MQKSLNSFFSAYQIVKSKKINNTDDMDIFKLPQGFWTGKLALFIKYKCKHSFT